MNSLYVKFKKNYRSISYNYVRLCTITRLLDYVHLFFLIILKIFFILYIIDNLTH